MNRRQFLQSAAAAAVWAPARPNLVYIVADDLGYAELGCQGGRDIATPNVDSLAANGVRFTNGYVSCPVCSPTRAGLMTGRYQQRFGHEFNPGPAEQAEPGFGLPLSETTLPSLLKQAGYATGMVGKWHLGYQPEYHPLRRGFDEFFGFLGGAHPYLPGRRGRILRGTEPVEEKEYLSGAFAREAAAFIERRRPEPFFLYLAFNAVHAPMQASEKYLAKFESLSGNRRTFAAMLSAMDDAVGRVLAALRGLDNTLIVFHSDNGGPTPVTTSANTPLRGFKGQVLEGGIRVPFLMQWAGRLPKGIVYDRPVIALDVLPTLVAAAGGRAPRNLDGVNLTPFLTARRDKAPHESLYWRFGLQWAIRQGDWKLVRGAGAPQLYNLEDDPGESRDLAAARPERTRALRQEYEAWNRQLTEPRWRTPRRARKRDRF